MQPGEPSRGDLERLYALCEDADAQLGSLAARPGQRARTACRGRRVHHRRHRHPRDELEARAIAAGLRVTSAVSRKTRLVVAADPDTESTKARRARELGIPLIAEPVFLTMLRRGVISDPLVTNGQKPSGAPARPPLAAHS